jgi:hypothetical protein
VRIRNLLAVILAFFVSTAAWASRGRPVSSLRFEGHLSLGNGFVASDGKDFLFLSSGIGSTTSVSSNPQVYVQRVVGGTPAGPSLGIGAGTAAGIVWTGIDYLVAGSAKSGMWSAHVSRQGTLIPGSARVVSVHTGGLFASNGQSALAVFRTDDATVLAQPLDLSGQTSGPAVPLELPRDRHVTVGPSGNGYAIVSAGGTGTFVWRVRPDGTPLTAAPVTLEGPYLSNAAEYHSGDPVVTTDGTDTLILFAGEKYRTGTDLKTAIIGPDGAIKRSPRTVFSDHDDGGSPLQPSALWTGSEYAVAIQISEDPSTNYTKADVGLLRINRSGDLVTDVTYATSGQADKTPTGLGWNGSQFLVPWSVYSSMEEFGSYCVAVPLATMTPTAPAVLGRTLTAQIGMKIVASNGQYLAAWVDSDAAVTTVRASRIDAAGNFLDGDGIALGTTVPPVDYFSVRRIAIDSDGTNWLVVWADGNVRGRLLSRAGSLLGAQPIPIMGGYDVAVRWNGVNYIVLAVNDSLFSAAISPDGVVTSSQTLGTTDAEFVSSGKTTNSYTSPSLVVVGGETIAVYQNVNTFCGGVQGSCSSNSTVAGWRLNSAANPVGAAVSLAKNAGAGLKLATDGTHLLLAWSAYDPASGTGSIFGTIVSASALQEATPFRIASNASLQDVASDGSEFVVGFASSAPRYTFPYPVGVLRVTPAGVVKETVMLPLGPGESAANLTIAANPGMPTLIGYADIHPDYDNRSRGALLFSNEFAPPALAVPSPPSVAGVLKDQNTIDVRWQPAVGALGTSVELQLEDGSYRPIGVAGANVASGRFSLAGLQGSAIRLRAWNAAGLSEPSASVAFPLPRQRAARSR